MRLVLVTVVCGAAAACNPPAANNDAARDSDDARSVASRLAARGPGEILDDAPTFRLFTPAEPFEAILVEGMRLSVLAQNATGFDGDVEVGFGIMSSNGHRQGVAARLPLVEGGSTASLELELPGLWELAADLEFSGDLLLHGILSPDNPETRNKAPLLRLYFHAEGSTVHVYDGTVRDASYDKGALSDTVRIERAAAEQADVARGHLIYTRNVEVLRISEDARHVPQGSEDEGR